ncbi:hypothetical protein D9M72_216190 [compost metagenome]
MAIHPTQFLGRQRQLLADRRHATAHPAPRDFFQLRVADGAQGGIDPSPQALIALAHDEGNADIGLVDEAVEFHQAVKAAIELVIDRQQVTGQQVGLAEGDLGHGVVHGRSDHLLRAGIALAERLVVPGHQGNAQPVEVLRQDATVVVAAEQGEAVGGERLAADHRGAPAILPVADEEIDLPGGQGTQQRGAVGILPQPDLHAEPLTDQGSRVGRDALIAAIALNDLHGGRAIGGHAQHQLALLPQPVPVLLADGEVLLVDHQLAGKGQAVDILGSRGAHADQGHPAHETETSNR